MSEKVESPDIRDIKGPVIYLWNPSLLLVAGLSLILLIGLFILYVNKAKKKKDIPLRPAHEIAYEALEALEKKELPWKERIDDYYFELSGTIRKYLENRFFYKAQEMTTDELLLRIRDSKELSQQQKGLLSSFLFHCDLVKFARYRPSKEEIDWSLKTSQEIIDQTKN